MKVTVLGSSAGVSSGARRNASVLLEIHGALYLLDAGEPVAAVLNGPVLGRYYAAQFGEEPDSVEAQADCWPGADIYSIRAVFISHFHADHVGGLLQLISTFAMWRSRMDPARVEGYELRVLVPPGKVDFFRAMCRETYTPLDRPRVRLVPIQAGPGTGALYADDVLEARAISNTHLARHEANASFSFDFSTSDGKRLVYSGDLGSAADLVPMLDRPVDLLVTEGVHIPREDMIAVLRDAPVRRVLLTHFKPDHYGRPRAFVQPFRDALGDKMEVTAAYDGCVVEA